MPPGYVLVSNMTASSPAAAHALARNISAALVSRAIRASQGLIADNCIVLRCPPLILAVMPHAGMVGGLLPARHVDLTAW